MPLVDVGSWLGIDISFFARCSAHMDWLSKIGNFHVLASTLGKRSLFSKMRKIIQICTYQHCRVVECEKEG